MRYYMLQLFDSNFRPDSYLERVKPPKWWTGKVDKDGTVLKRHITFCRTNNLSSPIKGFNITSDGRLTLNKYYRLEFADTFPRWEVDGYSVARMIQCAEVLGWSVQRFYHHKPREWQEPEPSLEGRLYL